MHRYFILFAIRIQGCRDGWNRYHEGHLHATQQREACGELSANSRLSHCYYLQLHLGRVLCWEGKPAQKYAVPNQHSCTPQITQDSEVCYC